MLKKLWTDLVANVSGYYDSFIAVLPKMLLALIVFLFFIGIATLVKRFVTKTVVSKMDDPLLARFLLRLVNWSCILIGFSIALKILGLGNLAAGLMAGAGVSAFIIGFAFKDIGENLLSGFLLAFSRPFRVGDTVEINGITGKIVLLNVRDTHMKTFDGKDVFIPNSTFIKNPVFNYTIDGYLRHEFSIGVDYDSDFEKAIDIIHETIKNTEGVLREHKKPTVTISSLDASSVSIKAMYWLDTFDKTHSALRIKTLAIENCLEQLERAGINMPGDIVELKNYRENPLKTGALQNLNSTDV